MYHIEAHFERDGQIQDCTQWEVLGDDLKARFATREEAEGRAKELQSELEDYDLDPSTVYTVHGNDNLNEMLEPQEVASILCRLEIPAQAFWAEAAGGDTVPMTYLDIMRVKEIVADEAGEEQERDCYCDGCAACGEGCKRPATGLLGGMVNFPICSECSEYHQAGHAETSIQGWRDQ